MPNHPEQLFDEAMFDIYRRAHDEVHYNATRFLQMLHEHRGIRTAQILLGAADVSDGYTSLWERGRLDLTVEALILDPHWNDLFTDEERQIARDRLQQYGYTFQV